MVVTSCIVVVFRLSCGKEKEAVALKRRAKECRVEMLLFLCSVGHNLCFMFQAGGCLEIFLELGIDFRFSLKETQVQESIRVLDFPQDSNDFICLNIHNFNTSKGCIDKIVPRGVKDTVRDDVGMH
ncbi:hypothetical protein PsorP6_012076 [Peronosclerospora sorghi]|uniref:Uncharacterized protein n=1 Tax=Peronosclerospora sorghi TaxID=230839 RepID=A0ACC0WIX9_9STRA|nr:hypothetical protein PsorP6_012076 [Peronosclerospora sorghi]